MGTVEILLLDRSPDDQHAQLELSPVCGLKGLAVALDNSLQAMEVAEEAEGALELGSVCLQPGQSDNHECKSTHTLGRPRLRQGDFLLRVREQLPQGLLGPQQGGGDAALFAGSLLLASLKALGFKVTINCSGICKSQFILIRGLANFGIRRLTVASTGNLLEASGAGKRLPPELAPYAGTQGATRPAGAT